MLRILYVTVLLVLVGASSTCTTKFDETNNGIGGRLTEGGEGEGSSRSGEGSDYDAGDDDGSPGDDDGSPGDDDGAEGEGTEESPTETDHSVEPTDEPTVDTVPPTEESARETDSPSEPTAEETDSSSEPTEGPSETDGDDTHSDPAGGSNLIAGLNFGFEDGLAGWIHWDDTPEITTDPGDVHGGKKALACGPDQKVFSELEVPLSILPPGNYHLSLYGRAEGPFSYNEAGLYFKGMDGDATPEWHVWCQFTNEVYTECEADFDVPEGLMSLFLVVNKGASDGWFFVDDYAIEL